MSVLQGAYSAFGAFFYLMTLFVMVSLLIKWKMVRRESEFKKINLKSTASNFKPIKAVQARQPAEAREEDNPPPYHIVIAQTGTLSSRSPQPTTVPSYENTPHPSQPQCRAIDSFPHQPRVPFEAINLQATEPPAYHEIAWNNNSFKEPKLTI